MAGWVLRVEGVPFEAQATDVARFFDISVDDIVMVQQRRSQNSRKNTSRSLQFVGVCFVAFPSREKRDKGMNQSGTVMMRRRVHCVLSSQEEMEAARRDNEKLKELSRREEKDSGLDSRDVRSMDVRDLARMHPSRRMTLLASTRIGARARSRSPSHRCTRSRSPVQPPRPPPSPPPPPPSSQAVPYPRFDQTHGGAWNVDQTALLSAFLSSMLNTTAMTPSFSALNPYDPRLGLRLVPIQQLAIPLPIAAINPTVVNPTVVNPTVVNPTVVTHSATAAAPTAAAGAAAGNDLSSLASLLEAVKKLPTPTS